MCTDSGCVFGHSEIGAVAACSFLLWFGEQWNIPAIKTHTRQTALIGRPRRSYERAPSSAVICILFWMIWEYWWWRLSSTQHPFCNRDLSVPTSLSGLWFWVTPGLAAWLWDALGGCSAVSLSFSSWFSFRIWSSSSSRVRSSRSFCSRRFSITLSWEEKGIMKQKEETRRRRRGWNLVKCRNNICRDDRYSCFFNPDTVSRN